MKDTFEEAYQYFGPLIQRWANNYSGLISSGAIDQEDLERVGEFALYKALEASEGKYRKFASIKIKGAMLDCIRKDSFVSRTAHEKGVRVSFDSLDYDSSEGDETDSPHSFHEVVPAPAVDDFSDSLTKELLLKLAAKYLNERERVCLFKFYCDGYGLKALSKYFRVSESMISLINKKALKKLRRAILKEGLSSLTVKPLTV